MQNAKRNMTKCYIIFLIVGCALFIESFIFHIEGIYLQIC